MASIAVDTIQANHMSTSRPLVSFVTTYSFTDLHKYMNNPIHPKKLTAPPKTSKMKYIIFDIFNVMILIFTTQK